VNPIGANSDKKKTVAKLSLSFCSSLSLSCYLNRSASRGSCRCQEPLHSRTARDPKPGIASLPSHALPSRPPTHPVASCVPSLSAIRRFPNPPSSTERDLLSPCPRPILFSTESCRGAFGIERGGINAAGPRAGRHRRAHAGCSLSRGGLSR
jgi:hypothetical protein